MSRQNDLLTGNRQRVKQTSPVIRKERSDLTVLRYMARRLHLMIQRFEQEATCTHPEPALYLGQERRGHMHRIVIYRQQELLLKVPLTFVGFISKRKEHLAPSILEKIQMADGRMVEELVGAPGILSYSSLELPHGNWCNLVIMNDTSIKSFIKNTETHTYASQHLARSYYEWIRLHHGMLPEGLDPMEMRLLKTRHYTYHADSQKPHIEEQHYRTFPPDTRVHRIGPVTPYQYRDRKEQQKSFSV